MRKIFITLLLSCCFSIPAYSQTSFPHCVSASSDPDGDGFGYENNSTCLVTDNLQSQILPQSQNTTRAPGACIDDDNDGWGWDGVQSCRVTPAANQCVDTDPVGDGWGWDGVQACRVGSSTGTAVTTGNETSNTTNSSLPDELAIIRSKFGAEESLYFPGFNRRGVAIFCPEFRNRPVRLMFLLANGDLKLLSGSGIWSGGWENDDNRLRFQWRRSSDLISIVSTVVISESSVTVDGDRECMWVE